MISLERVPPPTKALLTIERLQGWSMVLYCPMEAAAYLAMHKVIDLSDKVQTQLWLWGCRFWAFYVVLQLLHLVEDNRLLRLRARALERTRGHPPPLAHGTASGEKPASEEQQLTRRMWAELDERKDAILTELWVNIGYLPLTAHWSVMTGLISDTWVGIFGSIAAVASLRKGWRATA